MPDTTFHHRSYNHGYMTFGFPASYADHHSFNRYPHNPSYQPTSPAPPSTLPVQPGYVWDIRTCLRQSPAPPPMVPYLGPMSPRASEPVSARLTEQFYQPQLQVSLPAMSVFESASVTRFRIPGHRMQGRRHGSPLRIPQARQKMGLAPKLTTASSHVSWCLKNRTRQREDSGTSDAHRPSGFPSTARGGSASPMRWKRTG